MTLITWNAHKFLDKAYISDLRRISVSADIIFVQEALHSLRLQNIFASHFPFSFSFFKSFCNKSQIANGVQTGSRFLLQDNRNIISMDTEPITFTPKVTGISRIDVPGHGSVLLVNTHALNFNLGNSFERQIDLIASYIAAENGPIIWAGDFNTWNPSRINYLQLKATSLGLTHAIPKADNRKLILDHIYIRGFKIVKTEVLKETSSDHAPLKVVLHFN